MTIRYTPGENGLVGKSYKVEIVKIDLVETNYVKQPILDRVTIKYEDGKKETISGKKFFDSINMVQKSVSKRVL
jgi:hypothetical protein